MSIADLRKLESEANNVVKLSAHVRLKIQAILGSYDLVMDLADTGRLMIGRGSITAMAHIEYFANLFESACVLEVGRFCEFGSHSSIHLGGEHKNDSLINLGLGWHMVASKIYEDAKEPTHFTRGKTSIGNNVVVSAGAKIMSGVQISDGVVIGANALANKDLDQAAGVYAGLPAKLIGRRGIAPPIPWWRLPLSYILEFNNKDISASNLSSLERMCESDYTLGYKVGLLVTGKSHNEFTVKFDSIWHGEHRLPPEELPKALVDYFRQIESSANDFHFTPNIFVPFDGVLNRLKPQIN